MPIKLEEMKEEFRLENRQRWQEETIDELLKHRKVIDYHNTHPNELVTSQEKEAELIVAIFRTKFLEDQVRFLWL